MTAPPSQGEDGAPEGIKVAEERVPAGSYLTNVIKAGPVRADAAKARSPPVRLVPAATMKCHLRPVVGASASASDSPCEGRVFCFNDPPTPKTYTLCLGNPLPG